MVKVDTYTYDLSPNEEGNLVLEFKVNNEVCQLIVTPKDVKRMEFSTRLWDLEKFKNKHTEIDTKLNL